LHQANPPPCTHIGILNELLLYPLYYILFVFIYSSSFYARLVWGYYIIRVVMRNFLFIMKYEELANSS
jgi:hypothetical protein